MPDLRAFFKRNVATVKADGRRETAELVARLRRLTPAQFLAEPPETIRHLTETQYREIVAAIAPGVAIPLPVEPLATENKGFLIKLSAFWHARGALTRAMGVSVVAAVVITVLLVVGAPVLSYGLAPVTLYRSVDSTTWPACTRLAWDTDGCVYRTSTDLDWVWVAGPTHISTKILRYMNPHLPPEEITAGSRVVIWRARGHLVEKKQ